MKEKGLTCMFVGQVDDHDGDCYYMWHEHAKRYDATHDIIFLRRIHYQKEQIVKELVI